MKKKTKTIMVGIIISVFLIGIVSAGLIDYFGRITGSVSVEEPTFYPDSHIAEEYYNLFIDELPVSEEITLIDGENIIFVTESLGISYFYPAEYTIYIPAKTNVEGNKLWAELWLLDGNEDYKQKICPEALEFDIGETTNFWTYDKTCYAQEIDMDEDDRFALKIYGAGETSNYTLRVGDYSTEDEIMRIEVTAT